jgi:hypothetical protein
MSKRLSSGIVRVAGIAALIAISPEFSAAAQPVSFAGKVVTMVIPSTVGGSTDLAARLVARFIGRHLPGAPTVVSSNVPGGQGVPALNFMTQQAKPDGLTTIMPSSNEADPATYRMPQAHYDPMTFGIIGALGFGDTLMVMRADAMPRLYDRSKAPVIMGSVSGVPRGGMRVASWGALYLGWNIKWVTGYAGLPDLVLALERGEIEMTSFARFYLLDKLRDPQTYKILCLDGLDENARPSGRADVDGAPSFAAAMAGKITDPKMQAAYDYWAASSVLFKWLALPPQTPAPILDAYREAFKKTAADPDFVAEADHVMVGNTILSAEKTETIIKSLASTSDEARQTLEALLRHP